jgi:hypothetical protein
MVLIHELRKHVAVLQPLTVLREAGRVSDRIVRRQPHEPAVQAIVVQLLHQPSFRPNAVERACTAIAPEGSRGILRSNRAYQATVQLAQHITDKRPDPSQQMVRRHQRLGEMYENSRP